MSRSEKMQAAIAHRKGVDVVLKHHGARVSLSYNPRRAAPVPGVPAFRRDYAQATFVQFDVGSSALARRICRWAGHLVMSGAQPNPYLAVKQAIVTETAGWVNANRKRGIWVTP